MALEDVNCTKSDHVQDDGGIPEKEEKREAVLRRFYRRPGRASGRTSTGLGLSVITAQNAIFTASNWKLADAIPAWQRGSSYRRPGQQA